jgi:hypothetical protein
MVAGVDEVPDILENELGAPAEELFIPQVVGVAVNKLLAFALSGLGKEKLESSVVCTSVMPWSTGNKNSLRTTGS